jgi:uncharacterized SAM-binding protein YcdF (DUF218 family)
VVLTATALAWVSAALAVDAVGSRAAPEGRFDAIVVLGCRVSEGGRPSPALARRAHHAASLFHEGRAPRVVLTGGVGDHAPSEARVAAGVLLERGVPESALVLEERSTSTRENARFARALATEARRVLLVTDGFHALRATRVFLRHFEEVEVSPVTAGPWVRGKGAMREVPGLVIELARDFLQPRR